IGKLAFDNVGLKTVRIGKGISSVSVDAFNNNPDLHRILVYIPRFGAPNEVINNQPWGAHGASVYYLGEFVTFEHEVDFVQEEYARMINISAYIDGGVINYITLPDGKVLNIGQQYWPNQIDKYNFKVTTNGVHMFTGTDANGLVSEYEIYINDIGKPTIEAQDIVIPVDGNISTLTEAQILALVKAKATTIELGEDFSGGTITLDVGDLDKIHALVNNGDFAMITVIAESPTGLKATKKVTVTAKTNKLPVIEGLSELTIRQGQSVDLKDGVSANDLEDGVITDRIVYPTTDTATLAVGRHTLEYTVTDSDGNKTTVGRTIQVLTNGAPMINGAEDVTIKVGEVDGFDILAGITVEDDHDTINATELTVSGTVGKPEGGQTEVYIITYTATDSDNNETTVNRNVTVTNELPVIEGLSELTIRQGQSVDLK
ncbi:MAG: immunoglobulin-like domain-containing protein, partial [Culicoidibacterales bacterium]